jgi:DMSO/TMAO reductase YedYZ molybdopterin-dependent catalytic subunit
VVAAAIALGLGELVAVFLRTAAAPVIAVGNRVIELSPEPWTRWAIDTFGKHDKDVLIGGILVLLAIFAAGVGLLAGRRLVYGYAGIAVFTAWGVYCALSVRGSRASDVLPVLIGGAAAAAVLLQLLGPRPEATTDRRRFLVGSAGLAAFAALAGFGGRWWQHRRFDVSTSRRQVAARLPVPTDTAPDAKGADLGFGDERWQTPNEEFYRVDTTLDVPQVSAEGWKLRIHGMVDREVTLTYDQLLARPMRERWITLACVSNGVGGPYVGNARWLGTPLLDLLREAGVHADSDQLLMTDVNGMTIGAPAKVVMDGRDALLAIAMNGDPLPQAHGFPVRVVVPGLYGYVSACKWVVDIEATTYSEKAYWIDQGWVPQPELELMSRIDTPRENHTLKTGQEIRVAGVAWDQHVGVSVVEVQVDDGPWQQAGLAPVPTVDTWRQWVWNWTPTKGVHKLRVRATDQAGNVQTSEKAYPFPAGATGYHQITVRVE